MAVDPYQSDIPTPSREMPVRSDLNDPDLGSRSVVVTWILLSLLLLLFIGALYVFAPDRTARPTAQADTSIAQNKDASPR